MLLQLENLTFSYPAGPPVLQGVNLTVRPGERVALIGPNGAGKTTLLLHFNGILKPLAGRILWQGKDVAAPDFDRAAWRRQVGFVFQQPLHQLFCETVAAEVAFGLRRLGIDPEEIAARTKTVLAAVGLKDPAFYHRSPFTLSYGEQRRLALATALAMQPRLLVLDEAPAGLDVAGTEDLLALLDTFAEKGTAVILATHDLELAARWAQRVLVLAAGRIVRDGQPSAVFRETDFLAGLGLEAPVSYRLLAFLYRHGRPDLARELEHVLLGN